MGDAFGREIGGVELARLAKRDKASQTRLMLTRTIRLALPASSLLALWITGCAPAPRPVSSVPSAPVKAVPAPVQPAAPSPSAAWDSAPLTPGFWVYRADANGSAALFGQPASPAMLVVRCVRAPQQILVQRATPLPPGAEGALRIETSSRTAVLPVRVPFAGSPYLTAEVAANDKLLDAIAFSRGRWRLGGDGVSDVILPRAAEVARVVEDCRR